MEPISSLLDALIKLADRLINLEKTKFQDKQTVFNEIIKPLFEEMEPVASSYMSFFQQARQMVIQSRQADLLKVAAQLRSNRDAMVMARIKVVNAASAIPSNFINLELLYFSDDVERFFLEASIYLGEPGQSPRGKSKVTTFIQYLEDAALQKAPKQTILHVININLQDIEDSWAKVVTSFNKLKIQYTIPSKHITKPVAKKSNFR